MLEIRYAKDTGLITAWAGSPEHRGGHLKAREGEGITVVDCPTPIHPSKNYLIIDGKLKLIKEPEPIRDLATEIDEITATLKREGLIKINKHEGLQ